jgi:hypothetical protein
MNEKQEFSKQISILKKNHDDHNLEIDFSTLKNKMSHTCVVYVSGAAGDIAVIHFSPLIIPF